MNNLPRHKLREIERRHGIGIAAEPRRCEGLMRDNFPAHRREIAVLTAALEERVPAELLASGKGLVPRGALLARLAARLHDDVAMEASAARWTVHTWALALGVITAEELNALERAGAQEPAAGTKSGLPKQAAQGPGVTTRPRTTPANPAPISQAGLPGFPPSAASTSFVIAPDGSGNFLTISDAIRHAEPGSRLFVRPGIYDESLLLDKLLAIIGDGALEEIIVRATTSSCFVMRADAAIIRNLTLRGQARAGGLGDDGFFAVDIPHGRLLLDGCDISSDSLACVAIHNPAAMPVLHGCRIHHGADSGVFAFDGARGEIENCDIYENSNVGVAITGGASTSVTNCRVHDGADAGIVVWDRAASVIEGCEVYANRRTNVGVSDRGVATLRRCQIHDGGNTGLFAHRDGRATAEECDIYRHAAPEVAVAGGGQVRLRGCKIHDGQSHGVFTDEGGSALIEDCDVYRNLASGVHVDANGSAAARACRINENGLVGVSCQAGSVVEIEGCDLTRNRVAARETNYGSSVTGSNNRF
jgi:hypothetical protein